MGTQIYPFSESICIHMVHSRSYVHAINSSSSLKQINEAMNEKVQLMACMPCVCVYQFPLFNFAITLGVDFTL